MIVQANHPYRLDRGESVMFARDLGSHTIELAYLVPGDQVYPAFLHGGVDFADFLYQLPD
ncbi:hypothetical protein AGMMS49944_04230 [Spirochaetia bacterium]|nr:hypothetical protein AGMMS49944_04230 [Spirochaetia bacterium]